MVSYHRFYAPNGEPVFYDDGQDAFVTEDGEEVDLTGAVLEHESLGVYEIDMADDDGRYLFYPEEPEPAGPMGLELAQQAAAAATREAMERWQDHLDAEAERQEEAEEAAAEFDAEAERITAEIALEGVEERKAENRLFHEQRREWERGTGHTLTRDEAESLYERMRLARQQDPNATFGDAVSQQYPQDRPERSTAEALADAFEDTERQEHGGLTREQAATRIDRSGRPQDLSMIEIADGRYEVIEDV
jgi:hypothetical protein